MWGIEAEENEVIVDSHSRPESVLTAQLADDQAHLFIDDWTPSFSRLPTPVKSEALPVPLHNGIRLHQVNGLSPAGPEAVENGPEEPEGGGRRRDPALKKASPAVCVGIWNS
jgi:hypothetical protein